MVTVKKKGKVYLLIDLSDSMNIFVGTQEEQVMLTGTRRISPDGFTGLWVDKSEHAGMPKTKLDVAMAGMQGFVDRALATKVVGILQRPLTRLHLHAAADPTLYLEDFRAAARSHRYPH